MQCPWPQVAQITTHREGCPEPVLEPPHGNTAEYLVEWTPPYCRHILQLREQVSDVASDGEAPATLLHFMEGLRNRSPLSCASAGMAITVTPRHNKDCGSVSGASACPTQIVPRLGLRRWV